VAAQLLLLQQHAGNGAVAELLGARHVPPVALQRAPHGAHATAAARAEARDIARFEATRRRHDRNRAIVQGWLNAGAAQHADTRLRDSCEWANTGRAKIAVLTKVHDSAARSAAAGHVGGAAWFSYPAGDLTSAASYYTRRPHGTGAWDNTNVQFEDVASVDGFSDSNTHTVALMETAIANGPQYFYGVLKHEVQHAADDHGDTEIERYKTEFRAYWLGSGEFDSVSSRARVRHLGYEWNARQWAIFHHLYTDPAYDYVKTKWDADNAQPDRTKRDFQQAVIAFTRPESVNPDNSIRIDDFYEALKDTTPADCAAHTADSVNVKAGALLAALHALDAGERRQVRRNRLYESLLTTHLSGSVLTTARHILAR
jgi:hypothetical protein